MTDKDWRPIENIEELSDNVSVGVRAYDLVRDGRGSKAWEVRSDGGMALETGREIGPSSAPSVQCENLRRVRAVHLGENRSVEKRTQSQ
jgi:hypothetical protein